MNNVISKYSMQILCLRVRVSSNTVEKKPGQLEMQFSKGPEALDSGCKLIRFMHRQSNRARVVHSPRVSSDMAGLCRTSHIGMPELRIRLGITSRILD
jgi:hypothetical protein